MSAQWIWKSQTTINDYGAFYKNIEITDDIISGQCQITAHNHYKLFVNNKIVSGYVVPASSVANKEKLSLNYDLKPYLKKGNNEILVVVLYFGDYGQNYKKAEPGLWFNGSVTTINKQIDILSDTSWKVLKDIPYISDMPFQQSRKVTAVEKYDSRKSFNINNFEYARLSQMTFLDPEINNQGIKEGKIYEEIKPKFLKYKNGVSVFDVGKLISGFVRFNLDGVKDLEVTIRYSENLDENDFVGHNVANEISDNYKDIYIMSGLDKETHQFDFTYKAFRYFQVEGYSKAINELEVTALFAGTEVTIIKENKPITNDWRVDKIYDMFVQTQLNNIQGLLVDCPHREQAQYLGDSDVQLESIITNIEESKALMEKVLTDFMHEQFDDGTFPFVAPTNFVEPFKIIIPEYDLYYASILRKLYDLDQDKKVLRKYINTLNKVVKYALSLKDETGLLQKTENWHISDWPYPTVSHEGKYLTTYNLLALSAIRNLNYFNKELSINNNELVNDEKELLKAIRKHLINDEGLLIDTLPGNNTHQGVNSLGYLLNIFNEDGKENVLKFIEMKGFGSSVILGRSVLRVMQLEGRLDFIYKYLFEFDKGWMPMIEKGNLTFFEGYDDIESHSHAWQGFPIRMIQDYLKMKKE